MRIQTEISALEAMLGAWEDTIGDAYPGYRNHVYRMLHFCFALHDCSEEDREKLMIAACFHDIGIWTENTVDYIEPSIPPALEYLEAQGKSDWAEEISLLISEHHKLRRYSGPHERLVEVFRQADLVDFSLGMFRCGLDRSLVREVRAAIPNAGFHAFLLRIASAWFIRHPLNPAPMMKW